MKFSLRRLENLHIALWLMKDSAWVSDWKYLGMVMVIPAVLLAVYITWQYRKDEEELLHNLAVCFWICANTTWMIGEFFYQDNTRPLAQVFFAAGMLAIGIYYLKELWIWFRNRRNRTSEAA